LFVNLAHAAHKGEKYKIWLENLKRSCLGRCGHGLQDNVKVNLKEI
jgi:hypothetical protein